MIRPGWWLCAALVACSPNDPDADSTLGETAPSAEEVRTQLDELVAEGDSLLSAAAREAFAAYVADPGPPLWSGVDEQLEPADEAEAWRMLSTAALIQGHASTALWGAARGARLAVENSRGLTQVAVVLAHQDRDDEALPLLLRAVEVHPDNAVAHAELGHVHAERGDLRRAILHLTTATGLEPNHAWFKAALAEVWQAHGNLELASALLDQALMLTPGDAELQARRDSLPSLLPDIAPPPDPSALRREAPTQDSVNAEIAALRKPIDDAYAEDTASIRVLKVDADLQRTGAQFANLNNASICLGGCTDEMCREACELALCEAELDANATLHGALVLIPGRTAAAEAVWSGNTQLAFFQAVDRWRGRASDDDLRELEDDLDAELAGSAASVVFEYVALRAAVAIDRAQVKEQACGGSASVPDVAPGFSPADNPIEWDICLDGVLCVGLNNDEVTIGVTVLFVQFEVAVDVFANTFAFEGGVGVRDPSGTLSGALGIKLHSRKGVSAIAEVKGGFVVKIKGQVEHNIWHPGLDDD